jgi:hypothetical protein
MPNRIDFIAELFSPSELNWIIIGGCAAVLVACVSAIGRWWLPDPNHDAERRRHLTRKR